MKNALSKDGIETHRTINSVLNSYFVLGERGTGTNLAFELIQKNLAIRPQKSIRWKHGIPDAQYFRADQIQVITFRKADAWARSLFAKPWEAAPRFFDYDFSTFIREKWGSVYSKAHALEIGEDYAGMEKNYGAYLNVDRHPMTGELFRNIFELRNIKNQVHLSMVKRAPHVVFVQLEYLMANPEGFVQTISDVYKVPRNKEFEAIDFHHGGNRFWEHRKALVPNKMSPNDYAFMVRELDIPQEARLGYTY